ncbi:hypothetical protein CBS101457_002741 [Exobasidium rhododendri]|nr:hypothetical protein CBS101457_002741 [Exobasidium rhododendri]
MDGLDTQMNQISTQGSGKWLADSDLAKYVTPTDAALQSVMSFLTTSKIPTSAIRKSKYGDRVTVETTIGKVETMFGAIMNDYSAIGSTVSRTRTYTIPSSISPYIVDISPLALFGSVAGDGVLAKRESTTFLPAEAKRAEESSLKAAVVSSSSVPSSCNVSAVTPQCRKDYYGTASYQRSTGSSTQPDVAVIGFQNQWIDNGLLSTFTKKYATNIPSTYSVPTSAFNGAAKTGKPGFEAMLNMEAVVAEIYPLSTNYISMASIDNRQDPWLLTFTSLIEEFTSATRPKTVTISYSGDEKFWSASQAKSMCVEAQKLTALGTTIVVSTGDYGVAGTEDGACPPFVVRYPAACPYILAVGATEGFSPEQLMEPDEGGLGLLSSGSGASNLFTIPTYQAKQVKAYQSIIGSLNGNYNMSGRMYPDLVAQGSRYSIIFNRDTVASGTSASTPYVAALIALVNDKRKKAGKGTVGWANPPLYSSTTAMKDITVGGSYGCTSNSKLGFKATTGFDAASGLGSPTLDLLSKVFGV